MEGFFHTLKAGLDRYYQAKREIFEYMEIFYNHKKLQSSSGYVPPEESRYKPCYVSSNHLV
ncbi:MAG: hypothetical protein STSR0007_08260 [Thermovirga sp.]